MDQPSALKGELKTMLDDKCNERTVGEGRGVSEINSKPTLRRMVDVKPVCMTIPIACAYTSSSRSSVLRWIRDKQVEAFRDGRRVKILTASIDERIARLRAKAAK